MSIQLVQCTIIQFTQGGKLHLSRPFWRVKWLSMIKSTIPYSRHMDMQLQVWVKTCENLGSFKPLRTQHLSMFTVMMYHASHFGLTCVPVYHMYPRYSNVNPTTGGDKGQRKSTVQLATCQASYGRPAKVRATQWNIIIENILAMC